MSYVWSLSSEQLQTDQLNGIVLVLLQINTTQRVSISAQCFESYKILLYRPQKVLLGELKRYKVCLNMNLFAAIDRNYQRERLKKKNHKKRGCFSIAPIYWTSYSCPNPLSCSSTTVLFYVRLCRHDLSTSVPHPPLLS